MFFHLGQGTICCLFNEEYHAIFIFKQYASIQPLENLN